MNPIKIKHCIFKCQTPPKLSQLMDGHHQLPKYITTDNGKAIQTNKQTRSQNHFTNYHFVSYFVSSPLSYQL